MNEFFKQELWITLDERSGGVTAAFTEPVPGGVLYIRADAIAELIPECSCLPAYKNRGLIDPNCCYHAWFEDIDQLVGAGLVPAQET